MSLQQSKARMAVIYATVAVAFTLISHAAESDKMQDVRVVKGNFGLALMIQNPNSKDPVTIRASFSEVLKRVQPQAEIKTETAEYPDINGGGNDSSHCPYNSEQSLNVRCLLLPTSLKESEPYIVTVTAQQLVPTTNEFNYKQLCIQVDLELKMTQTWLVWPRIVIEPGGESFLMFPMSNARKSPALKYEITFVAWPNNGNPGETWKEIVNDLTANCSSAYARHNEACVSLSKIDRDQQHTAYVSHIVHTAAIMKSYKLDFVIASNESERGTHEFDIFEDHESIDVMTENIVQRQHSFCECALSQPQDRHQIQQCKDFAGSYLKNFCAGQSLHAACLSTIEAIAHSSCRSAPACQGDFCIGQAYIHGFFPAGLKVTKNAD